MEILRLFFKQERPHVLLKQMICLRILAEPFKAGGRRTVLWAVRRVALECIRTCYTRRERPFATIWHFTENRLLEPVNVMASLEGV